MIIEIKLELVTFDRVNVGLLFRKFADGCTLDTQSMLIWAHIDLDKAKKDVRLLTVLPTSHQFGTKLFTVLTTRRFPLGRKVQESLNILLEFAKDKKATVDHPLRAAFRSGRGAFVF